MISYLGHVNTVTIVTGSVNGSNNYPCGGLIKWDAQTHKLGCIEPQHTQHTLMYLKKKKKSKTTHDKSTTSHCQNKCTHGRVDEQNQGPHSNQMTDPWGTAPSEGQGQKNRLYHIWSTQRSSHPGTSPGPHSTHTGVKKWRWRDGGLSMGG